MATFGTPCWPKTSAGHRPANSTIAIFENYLHHSKTAPFLLEKLRKMIVFWCTCFDYFSSILSKTGHALFPTSGRCTAPKTWGELDRKNGHFQNSILIPGVLKSTFWKFPRKKTEIQQSQPEKRRKNANIFFDRGGCLLLIFSASTYTAVHMADPRNLQLTRWAPLGPEGPK